MGHWINGNGSAPQRYTVQSSAPTTIGTFCVSVKTIELSPMPSERSWSNLLSAFAREALSGLEGPSELGSSAAGAAAAGLRVEAAAAGANEGVGAAAAAIETVGPAALLSADAPHPIRQGTPDQLHSKREQPVRTAETAAKRPRTDARTHGRTDAQQQSVAGIRCCCGFCSLQ
jgi:hypothetical protein